MNDKPCARRQQIIELTAYVGELYFFLSYKNNVINHNDQRVVASPNKTKTMQK